MIRALLPALAMLWFVTVAAVTYRAFTAAARPVGISIERRALPVPVPFAVPSRPAAAPADPEPLPTAGVDHEPVAEEPPVAETAEPADLPDMPLVPPGSYRVAPAASNSTASSNSNSSSAAGQSLVPELPVPGWLPPDEPPVTAAPPPRRSRGAARPRKPAPQPEAGLPDEPKGVCLACGEAAESWVEQDGVRRGYCRKHVGKPVRVRPPRAEPAPPVADSESPETPASERAASRDSAETGSRQCGGMTRAGTRCRRKTKDPSGFCYQHRGR